MAVTIRTVPDSRYGSTAAAVADGAGNHRPCASTDGQATTLTYDDEDTAKYLAGEPVLNGATSDTIQLIAGGTTPIGYAKFVFKGDFLLEKAPVGASSVFVRVARFKGTPTAPITVEFPGMATAAADTDADKVAAYQITSRQSAGTYRTYEYFIAGEVA